MASHPGSTRPQIEMTAGENHAAILEGDIRPKL
jgi:hypothetical protein